MLFVCLFCENTDFGLANPEEAMAVPFNGIQPPSCKRIYIKPRKTCLEVLPSFLHLGKNQPQAVLTKFNLVCSSLSPQSQTSSVISGFFCSFCWRLRQSDSQSVKGTTVQKIKGRHCGKLLKD